MHAIRRLTIDSRSLAMTIAQVLGMLSGTRIHIRPVRLSVTQSAVLN